MAHPRLFRFGVQGRSLGPHQDWLAMLRRAEGFGFTSYLALDHFVRGFDTVASLAAAAMVTNMRVGSFVFDNDFRHPALTAKAAATIDVLSDGRFELGIGAGWLKEEYDQTGIPFEPASLRIAKLAEAIRLIKTIFTEEHPVSFTGEHYTVTDLICTPKPVSRPGRPHPPFIVGRRQPEDPDARRPGGGHRRDHHPRPPGRVEGHPGPHRRRDRAQNRLGP